MPDKAKVKRQRPRPYAGARRQSNENIYLKKYKEAKICENDKCVYIYRLFLITMTLKLKQFSQNDKPHSNTYINTTYMLFSEQLRILPHNGHV